MKRILAIVLLIIVLIVVITVPFIIWGGGRFTSFSDQEKAITSFLLASLELIGLIVSIAIVVFILYQTIQYRLQYRFVFEAFSNESEFGYIEKKLLNLSLFARDELVRQVNNIYKELKGYSDRDFETLVADELYNEQDHEKNASIKDFGIDLAEIVKIDTFEHIIETLDLLNNPQGIKWDEIAPKEISPIFKVIEAVIPLHVIKATGYLQWGSHRPGGEGITFEFV